MECLQIIIIRAYFIRGDTMDNIDTSIFLNYDKIFSYNAKLNFIVTERGLGKSFGAKDYVTNHFKKTKKQFVYIRRFKTELHEALFKEREPIFFNQIKSKYPNDDLTNTKDVFKINNQIARVRYTTFNS